jgi:glucose dehydrogenase
MVVYTVLVLLYRADLRIAIATSVVIMAVNSVMGSVYATALGRMTPEVFYNWVAAAPVVLFFAPLGALMMRVIPRGSTMVFVALLCIGQLVWAVFDVGAGWIEIVSVIAAVLVLNGAFHMLDRLGRKLADRTSAAGEA